MTSLGNIAGSASSITQHVERRLEITQTLIGLLDSESLDHIGPLDLCRACGISRSTFYRYFSSVEQVPMWYRDFGAALGMNQIGRFYTCRTGHLISIRLLADSASLYRYYFGSPRTQNPDFNYTATGSHVRAMEEVLVERGVTIDNKMAYQLEALAYGCCVAVSSWMRRGMDISVAEITDVLVGLYPPGLLDVFDNPSTPRDPSPLLAGVGVALARGL